MCRPRRPRAPASRHALSSHALQIESYNDIDPISGDSPNSPISPPVKLALALGVLLLAVMAYAQSVRLSVHVGEPGRTNVAAMCLPPLSSLQGPPFGRPPAGPLPACLPITSAAHCCVLPAPTGAGYLIRVVASNPAEHWRYGKQLEAIMRRSSLCFAVGLRLFFSFGPLVLYALGEFW